MLEDEQGGGLVVASARTFKVVGMARTPCCVSGAALDSQARCGHKANSFAAPLRAVTPPYSSLLTCQ
jgi:hypothetical protein